MEEHLEELALLAEEFIESLPRHDKLLARRFVEHFKDEPRATRDMGFLQFVKSKIACK